MMILYFILYIMYNIHKYYVHIVYIESPVTTEISRTLRQRAPSSAPLAEAGLSAGPTAAVGEGGRK